MALLTDKNLLIVGNFSSGTGYAWKTINEYFVELAKLVAGFDAKTIIVYPKVTEIPEALRIPELEVLSLDFSSAQPSQLFRFVRRHKIHAIYLTDRPVYSWKYLLCRMAGVRRIIIHDHTSGDRANRGKIGGWLKAVICSYPFISVDHAVAISDFVRNRMVRTTGLPRKRISRIWNGIDVERFRPEIDDQVFRQYGIAKDKKVVFAYSRANRYKGIQTLIEAADILIGRQGRRDLYFLFCGDGPDIEIFRDMVSRKGLDGHFLCPGSTNNIERLLHGACIVVVPSIWQEGFGLSLAEGMAAGKAVIATEVGGIPEIIQHSGNGLLYPPGDAVALSESIAALADDDTMRDRLGVAARETVMQKFNLKRQKEELVDLFRTQLGLL